MMDMVSMELKIAICFIILIIALGFGINDFLKKYGKGFGNKRD